ncbi:conserved hypothetical protein [Ricinus communis]|uniref:S-protein homolog n=1 Tax=Ricinus communis TaxID=3988 RepID=B9SUI5_RICCO|nr:conserved hypothetical protein [Ricinus communis]
MKGGTMRQYTMFILVLVIVAGRSEAFEIFPKYHVHVVNGLKKHLLQTHCVSVNDDLGVHDLAPRQEQVWAFRINISFNTRFECTLSWKGGKKRFDAFYPWFDGVNFMREHCVNYNCYWRAQEDGIYLVSSQNRRYTLKYPIRDPKFHIDMDAYKRQGPLYLSTNFAMIYALEFSSFMKGKARNRNADHT